MCKNARYAKEAIVDNFKKLFEKLKGEKKAKTEEGSNGKV